MRARSMRWLFSIAVLLIIGLSGAVLLGGTGADVADASESQTTSPRTDVSEPANTLAGWNVYWQNPSDTMPTIVHETCPLSERTQSAYQIEPGQWFLGRSSTCQPYNGQEVLEVKLRTKLGKIVQGYVVRFDSFEPIATK